MNYSVLRKFSENVSGSIAVPFAIASAALMTAGGIAVDYGLMTQQKSKLQSAVDAGALAAASELQVANITHEQIRATANQTVTQNLGTQDGTAVSIEVEVGEDEDSITVTASLPVTSYFVNWTDGGAISVKAVAELHTSGVPLCVLGLAQKSGKKVEPGLTLNDNARLTADKCAVYSNATKPDAIESGSGSLLEAELICSSGGTKGDARNFDPDPQIDCPRVEDPLQGRPEPFIGGCDFTDFQIGIDKNLKLDERFIKEKIKNETADEASGGKAGGKGKKHFEEKASKPVDTSGYDRTEVFLSPGVYCGGLTIGSGIRATFRPGEYIMKSGPLYVTEEATIDGENVGFFFSGKDSNLYFGPYTSISLTAPTAGAMAGLLFFEERFNKKVRPHAILSDDARKLEGTIYLPAGHLYIDADAPIADQSAYTAIIVSRLELFAGPHLVLNTDYTSTDVPVPEGVSNLQGEPYLAE